MADRVEAGPPVRLGSRPAGAPIRTGWDTPPAPPPELPIAYVHTQTTPASVWSVTHNLGRYPIAWSLFADGKGLCEGYVVHHVDTNHCLVSMDIPSSGLIRFI